MIVGSFLIICLSNYVSLTSLSPLNNQVLVCGEQHQIDAQFNFTLLQDWKASSDYSACFQSPLNYYFSPRYLHDAASLFSPLSLSLYLSHSLSLPLPSLSVSLYLSVSLSLSFRLSLSLCLHHLLCLFFIFSFLCSRY